MKRFFVKALTILKVIGLVIFGLFALIYYFFKWLGQRLIIFVRDTKWVRKTLKVLASIFKLLYTPIYYAVYLISIVLRFCTCICYALMFNPGRAWRALKLIFK